MGLFALAKQYFTLKQQVEKNSIDILELQKQAKELTEAFHRLAYELHRDRENAASERRIQLLEIENRFLRFERQLPPSKPLDGSDA